MPVPKSPPAIHSVPASAVAARLARWYRRNGRDLPWRRTRDPYRIWISEVMLQQTQVATVIPYYRRFLRRLPTLAALAAAPVEEVLSLWSGLGYYRRARGLHAAAREVMRRHGGRLPGDPAALRALPGIGAYTAGAVASIAFGARAPAIDGNARRVLARLLGLRGPVDEASNRGEMEAAARALLQSSPPGEITQGLMELGALVCLPSRPRCPACPLRRDCRARASGRETVVPETRPGRRPELREAAVALIRNRGRFLMIRRPEGEALMGGLWELPGVFVPPGGNAAKLLEQVGRERLGTPIRVKEHAASLRQTITYRRIRLDAYRAVLAEPAQTGESVRWVAAPELASLPHGSATRRLVSGLTGTGRPGTSRRRAVRR